MAGDNDLHRDIGKHDAQIEALQESVRLLHVDMQSMAAQLQTIQQTLSEAKGGWRTLMWIGGAGAAVGISFYKAIAWFVTLPQIK
jgi:prefoldin subunit 5